MKSRTKKKLFTAICVLFMVAALAIPCSIVTGSDAYAATTSTTAKNGLKKVKGKYYYYQNGKKIKSKWKTIKGKKYYFKKSGEAAVLTCKIKGKYYIFNKKGQLVTPKSTKIVTIGNEKYRVNAKGQAVGGWTKSKKYRFYENGKMVTGIEVFNEKFYYFNASGKYNAEKTAQLRKAAKYEKDFSDLKALIGEPKKAKYYDGCYGDGKDGILTYDKFTVYTYKATDGSEIFMGAE
ncbi:MAG: hypothetical protein V8R80_05655 [Eubacterium sp.]